MNGKQQRIYYGNKDTIFSRQGSREDTLISFPLKAGQFELQICLVPSEFTVAIRTKEQPKTRGTTRFFESHFRFIGSSFEFESLFSVKRWNGIASVYAFVASIFNTHLTQQLENFSISSTEITVTRCFYKVDQDSSLQHYSLVIVL